ncbi:MAG: acetate/propionate family kinase, partial [Haliea sp.]
PPCLLCTRAALYALYPATNAMTEAILVLNAGSSSIKFALYPVSPKDRNPFIRGKIEGIGRAPKFHAMNVQGRKMDDGVLDSIDTSSNHGVLTERLLDWLEQHDEGYEVAAVGHRVVHGGRDFSAPVHIDKGILKELGTLISLAPLHQPNNIIPIESLLERDGRMFQVACFDTAFHRTQPRLSELFALPRRYADEGVIRYGFHGLSYQYIAGVLPEYLGEQAGARIVVAHLGNGASLCAMRKRKSVATSMGFTALDGLMMGSRCGAIDPGVVLYLMQERGMTADQIQHLLYNESGLLGVSGISNNMQILLENSSIEAEEAVDLFCYRAANELAALLVPLKGLDTIVFTAGIGENSAAIRAQICGHLDWLGIEIDVEANIANSPVISGGKSKIIVLVIPTDEEGVIAEATRSFLRDDSRRGNS